jgi:hypothetical protein
MKKRRGFRILCQVICFAALFFLADRLCKKATDGFALEWIKYPLKDISTTAIDPEIGKILRQPFHYLGRGGQCFAFLSDDGQFVLKVFKQHHLRLPALVQSLVPKSIAEHFKRKEQQFLTSCHIASTDFAEETGVVFSQTTHCLSSLPSHILLNDPLCIAHEVPLAKLPFVLQKKAILVDVHLEKLMKQGRIEEAKLAIDQLIALVKKRCEKGIADNDPVLNRNFGFIEGRAVEIDIGSYSYDSLLKMPEHMHRELFFELHHFHDHLYKRFPELAAHVEKALQRTY